MKTTNEFLTLYRCDICGLERGNGKNHSKCSKARVLQHKDRPRGKNDRKLKKERSDKAAIFYREQYD